MCGRFNVSHTPGLETLLRDLALPDAQLQTQTNLAPTETVPLIRRDTDKSLRLQPARWWLTPSWAKGVEQKYAMFNARAEGLNRSAAFKKPFATQRGIVPMASFIEWRESTPSDIQMELPSTSGAERRAGKVSKQPWLISDEAQGFAAAALWDVWRNDLGEELLSCAIVTTAAAPAFAPWHSRMPVLLVGAQQHQWLDNEKPVNVDDAIFASALKKTWHLTPLHKSVGNSRNKAPDVLRADGEIVRLPADTMPNK